MIYFIISILLIASTACASDIELYGETKVEAIRFQDMSIQLTATQIGPAGPQGIPGQSIVGPTGPAGRDGIDGVDGAPGPTASERILYINTLSIVDFVPVWLKQGALWTPFLPAFSLTFNKVSDTSLLRLSWSDNVGIYGPSWCNIGLFLNDSITTTCSGSWSGVSSSIIFNQQKIDCVLPNVPAGTHTLHVKHRSQYCVFGNYAFDSEGLNRHISVEEQN